MKLLPCTTIVLGVLQGGSALGQDWGGPFTIIPVCAPDMVLEAVDAGTVEGTKVSIGSPTGKDQQRWVIEPGADDGYVIRPAYSGTLALAAAGGGTANGTPIVLETAAARPSQAWTIRQNPGGSFSLLPKHALDMALDDYGGGAAPGARQDLWTYNPADEHLQWRLRPLPGATWPAAVGDLNRPPPPRGTTREFTFTESRIFPGTRRAGTVFIPAQYDGRQPACVYVRQDGYNPREKGMLEALIAAAEMPVTVGVFVRPGELPAPMQDTLGRRNRCFEYDAVNDNYVRFLTEELLPFVARTFDLKLSASGNDRCIAGGSSGGISAFNAAWQRPDAFSRVYANSGSFVAFRGGHEFPTLVRKSEPRPIRAYLTTGTRDMENCAGDWYLLDLEMDRALKFSGYDYVFHALEGGHVAGWNEHFQDAMRFLWKGWPAPVQAGPGAPRVQDVIGTGSAWELAAEGRRDARSPACNSRGEVFFVDAPAATIQRIGTDGRTEVFATGAGLMSGLAVGPNDEVYAVSASTGRILCYDRAGVGHLHAEGIPGQYVLARPDGSLYVTSGRDGAGQGSSVWLVKDGHKTEVDSGLKRATGLAYRPDQWLLAVADGGSKWGFSYQINPDGTLAHKERYFWLHVADWEDDAGAESICYAREGHLLVATHLGIQICADDGPTQVILPVPDRNRVTGVCLGGPGMNTLYAFCGERIWKRTVKLHAIGPFSPWEKVKGTPL